MPQVSFYLDDSSNQALALEPTYKQFPQQLAGDPIGGLFVEGAFQYRGT